MSLQNILLLSVAEIAGDFNLRWYAQTNKLEFLGAGLVGYAGVIYYLITCLRTGNVLYVNGMWDGMSAALESIVAYIVLGDRLEHPINYIGLVMVIIGILLMKS